MIAIVGASGMLGTELVIACQARGLDVLCFTDPEQPDVTDAAQVRGAIPSRGIDLVLNASGYTDVDGAESEPDLAMRVNATGPGHLAARCREIGAMLVHYSTDYVFDGRAAEPYAEDAAPSPLNAYGRSKLAGEEAIRATEAHHLIVRSSWLFAPHGRNFVRTILELAARMPQLDVVDDQFGRPTACSTLADLTMRLVERGASGTIHAANEGVCSWFEFATAIVTGADLPCCVRPCTSEQMTRPATRPRRSVLDLTSMIELIGPPPHWGTDLRACLEAIRGRADAPEPSDPSTSNPRIGP